MQSQVEIELYDHELQKINLRVSQPRQCLITGNEIIHYALSRKNGVIDWHKTEITQKELLERMKTLLLLVKYDCVNRDRPRLYTVMPYTDEIIQDIIVAREWTEVVVYS